MSPITIEPGLRRGKIVAPPSKSHEHRLLIADFLSGNLKRLSSCEGDADDILATKRCLRALAQETSSPLLDCGESGSTRRFLSPVAAALGKRPIFEMAGRLAERPQVDWEELKAGKFVLDGSVSSQFVTGLLFALPILNGDSSIRFSSPLQSRGYVEMTTRVLSQFGIVIHDSCDGYDIPGNQRYKANGGIQVEGDWSGAAFWFVMNFLGGEVEVSGLDEMSAQPDRAVLPILKEMEKIRDGGKIEIDVSSCPDLFPTLSVAAGSMKGESVFVGTKRLRLKESDRCEAMANVLRNFGVECTQGEDTFVVHGSSGVFNGCEICTHGDHRIAMASAIGAVRAKASVTIDNADCAAKSYPTFFKEFFNLERIKL